MIKYKPRLTAADMPENDNKYYIRKSDGGYSPCIGGYPQHKHLTALSNCVGWAIGRAMEILQTKTSPFPSRNAEDFYNSTTLEKGQTPKNGAIVCWRQGQLWNGGDGAGHVAVVEKVLSENEIITSESAYGGAAFYTKRRVKGNGNWGMNSRFQFMGFIYLPEECIPDDKISQKTDVKGGTNMATNLNIQGVDISYCQQGLDYEKLKADGIKFAIIRASYTGTSSHKQGTNSLLNRHVNGCISQGIDYGFYHYSCATNVEEAKREAQYIVQAIKEFPLPKYPVFFDAEEAQIAAKGKKATTEIALAFINEVERLGYPSGIYANPSWMETYLDKKQIIKNADIWLAHWVSKSNYKYGQKMWQNGLRYSAGMQIDSDICFVNYPQETSEWYKNHGKILTPPITKSLEEIAKEVWAGKWGYGQQRYNDLTAAGYDYYAVQDLINKQIAEQQKENATIKIGSKVKLKQGAKTYTGGKLASFVYNRPHIVTELIDDRAVISYGNVVVAAVNVKDLLLV